MNRQLLCDFLIALESRQFILDNLSPVWADETELMPRYCLKGWAIANACIESPVMSCPTTGTTCFNPNVLSGLALSIGLDAHATVLETAIKLYDVTPNLGHFLFFGALPEYFTKWYVELLASREHVCEPPFKLTKVQEVPNDPSIHRLYFAAPEGANPQTLENSPFYKQLSSYSRIVDPSVKMLTPWLDTSPETPLRYVLVVNKTGLQTLPAVQEFNEGE